MGTAEIAAGASSNKADQPVSLDDAYRFCGSIARSHYENFTIASWLMPREMRRHMYAIYAYARIADDFADEERDLTKLDQWEAELGRAYQGRPRHPVFVALADSARRFNIPKQPFADLLVAFRSDVNFKGFDSIDALLDYCRYSANPVGRLVLYLFGYADPERQALSDKVCSGLQLANFWQDIALDLDKGRIYLPLDHLERFNFSAEDLRRRCATPAFKELMRHEIQFARQLLHEGARLGALVDRRLRRDILMFAGGGLMILRAIERVGFDVFSARPALTKTDYLRLGFCAVRGRLPQ